MKTEDYGVQIRSWQQAQEYDKVWCHFGHTVLSYYIVSSDSDSWFLRNCEKDVLSAIILGSCWSTEAGCARHLRAMQTRAKVREMADGNWGSQDDLFSIYWNNETDKFEPIYTGFEYGLLFKSRYSVQHCIDTFGQNALKEIYEAGESL